MEKILLLIAVASIIFGMLMWVKNREVKEEKVYEHDGSGLFDFVPKFHMPRGWYGYFFDGTVQKYGIVEGLSKDDLVPFRKIRVFTKEMKEGVWDLLPIDFEEDFPLGAVVLTYEDHTGWHCAYPGEKRLAMAGCISNVPQDFSPGVAVKAENIKGNEFKFVSSL